ncbi:MAG TPA: M1 family aminopeptidase [Pyrinomonadaceae bacterium]|nr:M1 family aminopeptidase [Pyrinomonadaceae bacterium]
MIARAARAVARGAATRNARTPWKSATTTCALLALLVLLLAHADARDFYARHTELDAQQYRIRVRVDDSTDNISATAEIVVAVRAAGVREVPLDFAGLEVDDVEVNGRPARFTRAEQKLRVALTEAFRSGDSLTVSVKYHGSPADGLYFKRNKFGDRTIFADNWPNRAHQWFPAIDHPYDKAKVEFFVNAPARYSVVANGRLIETTKAQDGTRLTHWREDVPVPVYCMVFGATEFAVFDAGAWGGVPLSYYLYPQDRERGLHDYGRALDMLKLYTDLVGPFPYEKLALVQSSTRFGGMENSSNIFFDENAYDGSGKLESTVAHEVAHQWFGDSVTEADWHHLWLSEGFATYFTALFFERADGRERFRQIMLDAKERYIKDAAVVSRPVYDPSVTDLFKLLNRNNYEKGGWVLHMLRGVLGDEKFFAGVREYYSTYRDGNALTEDFRRVMERQSGRPLEWFFRQWIYRPGFPALEAAWHWDAPTKRLRLRLRQTQAGAAFRLPLEVEFDEGGAPRRESVELSARAQTFSFTLGRKPLGVRVDPDDWVLKTLNIREE